MRTNYVGIKPPTNFPIQQNKKNINNQIQMFSFFKIIFFNFVTKWDDKKDKNISKRWQGCENYSQVFKITLKRNLFVS